MEFGLFGLVLMFVFGLLVGCVVIIIMLIRSSSIGIDMEEHYMSMLEDVVYSEAGFDKEAIKAKRRRELSRQRLMYARGRKRCINSMKMGRWRRRRKVSKGSLV